MKDHQSMKTGPTIKCHFFLFYFKFYNHTVSTPCGFERSPCGLCVCLNSDVAYVYINVLALHWCSWINTCHPNLLRIFAVVQSRSLREQRIFHNLIQFTTFAVTEAFCCPRLNKKQLFLQLSTFRFAPQSSLMLFIYYFRCSHNRNVVVHRRLTYHTSLK